MLKIILTFCVLGWLGSSALHGEGLPIVAAGRSDYVIYVAADASAAERYAATELQGLLKQISDVELPIADHMPADGAAILVGSSPAVAALCPDIDFERLQPDEIILRTVGTALVLAGERPRGSIYAVYELLETQFGVRFWSLDARQVPRRAALTVPELNYRYAPPFPMREAFSFETNRYPDIAVKLRNNGHYNLDIPDHMGDHYVYGIDFCHTFNLILPPERYLETTDYFTLLYGNRQPAQLCLSNPAMRREFIRRLFEYMDANPEQKLIALSQVDGGLESHSCQCERCVAMRERLGGSTDMLIDFVNEVADAVAAKDPEVLIETLAYSYTTTPPRTCRPRSNIIIRLCIWPVAPFRPLSDPANAAALENYRGWRAVTERISLWLYKVDFASTLTPYPNLFTYGDELKYFAGSGAIFSVFEQGMQRGFAEFQELRAYLASKLMWNPALDDRAVIAEFVTGYYGPGAEAVRNYLAWQEQAAAAYRPEVGVMSFELLLRSRQMMQEALAGIDPDSPFWRRLKMVAFSINCGLAMHQQMSWNSGDPAVVHHRRLLNPEQLLAELEADAALLRIGYGSEHGLWPETFKSFQANLVKPTPKGAPPVIDRVLADGQWQEWYAEELGRPQDQAAVVADPKGTLGLAAAFRSDAYRWILTVSMPKFSGVTPREYEIWVAARCLPGAAPEEAPAFGIGIHNSTQNTYYTNPHEITIPVGACQGDEFRWFKVGSVELLNDSVLVFLTAQAGGGGTEVRIDRVIAVEAASR